MQLTQAQLDDALAALIDTGAPFDPAATFVGVGTAMNDVGLDAVMADVTKATGAMATAIAVTAWSDVYHLDNGCSAVDSGVITFAPASSSEGQTLAVWYLGNLAVSTVLKAYRLITPPVVLPDEFHSWNIVVRLTLDPSGQWDASVEFNG